MFNPPVIVETDRPIADLPFDAIQMCPLFTESGPFDAQIRTVLHAGEGRTQTAVRFTQHFLMHWFHPRYRSVDEIADNFEFPGCHTDAQVLAQIGEARKSVPAPDFCYPECEFDLQHHGSDALVMAAYVRVRRILIERGLASASWSYDQWRAFSWKAYSAIVRQTLDALGWSKTIWYSSNVHGDHTAWFDDDYGNRVPPVERHVGRLDNLYTYPAGEQHDGRGVTFAARTRGVVHVAVGKTGGGVIAPEQVERRVERIRKAGGIVNLFVGDPDAGQGASALSCGQCAIRVCRSIAT